MNYRTIALSLLLLAYTPAWASDLDGLNLTITIPTSPDAIFTYEDADGNTVTEGLPGYDDSASLPDESDFNDEKNHRAVTDYGESIAASATQTVNASIESKPKVDTTITPRDPSSIDDVTMRDCSHADIDCERSESTSSSDVPGVATWIGVVTSAGNDAADAVNRDSIRVFHANAAGCRDWSRYGSLNCCSDSGFISNFKSCNQSEKDIGAANALRATVHLGQYCSSRVTIRVIIKISYCETKTSVYCVFKSKLDRIVQQQIRIQTGVGFGSWNAPNCEGIHPDDLVDIDLAKLDLSEFLGDAEGLVDDKGRPSNATIIAMLTDKIPQPDPEDAGGGIGHAGGTPVEEDYDWDGPRHSGGFPTYDWPD